MQKADFIQKYAPHIVKACIGTKLFPSVCLAQMALESGWGESLLSKQYNNCFGVKKGKDWQGETIELATPNDSTPTSLFRVYASPYESIRDRNKFLLQNPRYQKNGVFDAQNYKQQIQAIAKAGYAEDPDYEKKIIATIEKNQLYQFDKLIPQKQENQTNTNSSNNASSKQLAFVTLTLGLTIIATTGVIAALAK